MEPCAEPSPPQVPPSPRPPAPAGAGAADAGAPLGPDSPLRDCLRLPFEVERHLLASGLHTIGLLLAALRARRLDRDPFFTPARLTLLRIGLCRAGLLGRPALRRPAPADVPAPLPVGLRGELEAAGLDLDGPWRSHLAACLPRRAVGDLERLGAVTLGDVLAVAHRTGGPQGGPGLRSRRAIREALRAALTRARALRSAAPAGEERRPAAEEAGPDGPALEALVERALEDRALDEDLRRLLRARFCEGRPLGDVAAERGLRPAVAQARLRGAWRVLGGIYGSEARRLTARLSVAMVGRGGLMHASAAAEIAGLRDPRRLVIALRLAGELQACLVEEQFLSLRATQTSALLLRRARGHLRLDREAPIEQLQREIGDELGIHLDALALRALQEAGTGAARLDPAAPALSFPALLSEALSCPLVLAEDRQGLRDLLTRDLSGAPPPGVTLECLRQRRKRALGPLRRLYRPAAARLVAPLRPALEAARGLLHRDEVARCCGTDDLPAVALALLLSGQHRACVLLGEFLCSLAPAQLRGLFAELRYLLLPPPRARIPLASARGRLLRRGLAVPEPALVLLAERCLGLRAGGGALCLAGPARPEPAARLSAAEVQRQRVERALGTEIQALLRDATQPMTAQALRARLALSAPRVVVEGLLRDGGFAIRHRRDRFEHIDRLGLGEAERGRLVELALAELGRDTPLAWPRLFHRLCARAPELGLRARGAELPPRLLGLLRQRPDIGCDAFEVLALQSTASLPPARRAILDRLRRGPRDLGTLDDALSRHNGLRLGRERLRVVCRGMVRAGLLCEPHPGRFARPVDRGARARGARRAAAARSEARSGSSSQRSSSPRSGARGP